MKLSITTGILFLAGAPLLLPASITEAQRNAIDQATGAKGVYTEAEDTYKVTFPRIAMLSGALVQLTGAAVAWREARPRSRQTPANLARRC